MIGLAGRPRCTFAVSAMCSCCSPPVDWVCTRTHRHIRSQVGEETLLCHSTERAADSCATEECFTGVRHGQRQTSFPPSCSSSLLENNREKALWTLPLLSQGHRPLATPFELILSVSPTFFPRVHLAVPWVVLAPSHARCGGPVHLAVMVLQCLPSLIPLPAAPGHLHTLWWE